MPSRFRLINSNSNVYFKVSHNWHIFAPVDGPWTGTRRGLVKIISHDAPGLAIMLVIYGPGDYVKRKVHNCSRNAIDPNR